MGDADDTPDTDDDYILYPYFMQQNAVRLTFACM